jgi:DNA-binding transcriptional regulator YiaG
LVAAQHVECREVAGFTFTATIPVKRCESCREEYFELNDLAALNMAIAGELARHGEMSGESFRFMRKALGMRALELAELLDVTHETVSRWEHERLPVERRAAALLSAMVLDRLEGRTATLDRLKTLLKPDPLPKLVQLVPRLA